MTNMLAWHSATGRPVYHDDTRCPDGAAIGAKDRHPGDGERDQCEHCSRFLVQSIVQSIEARVRLPGSVTPP